jgi:hypothetical protein
MKSVPIEGLAWFVELTLAIGLLTACTAGLTFSAWCESFTMAALFDPTGLLMPK